ncbi:MAG: CotH kinase family protein [Treponema sp.]|jgi:hypothetical protein|nr:CotH kinase family protein [Treponema sp.]
MTKKFKLVNIIITLLFALAFLFVSCPPDPENGDDDSYNNPNAGARDIKFSHNSGLYNSPFNLTLTTASGGIIYYSIDGSIPSPAKVGNGRVFKYTAPINIQNRNGQPNFLATPAWHFYMDPEDPRGHAPPVYNPTNDQVPKATVIRAIVVDSSGKHSDSIIKTYFIGNNLQSYGNIRIISLVTDPRNLVDEDYGIMVRGKPENRWHDPRFSSEPHYNFMGRGTEWERAAFMELFDGNASSRTLRLSTNVGIRVRGGWSRGHGQKSLNVYFRSEHGGINNYRPSQHNGFVLIPGAVKADGTPVDTTKSIMLRSGGNDHEYTKFYDVFIHDLLKDRSFTTQATIPAVLYLNGEYWGPYNFSERYSNNHTEYKYGVDRNLVISIDNGLLDDGNPGEDQSYWDAVEGFANGSITYAQFCSSIDIDNFIDYWAAQIYIHNQDWPNNNYVVWRTRTVVLNNPYGDTKWRYSLHDTEFSMGIYSSGSLTGTQVYSGNIFERLSQFADNGDRHSRLFRALMDNIDFSKQFVNTMMDLYNVNFHPNRFEPRLNHYAATYSPLMEGYRTRWGDGGWNAFDAKVNDAKNYLTNIRPAMTENYLPDYFSNVLSGSSLYDVTVSVTGVSNATVKINTVTPNLAGGSWTGKYYSGNSITVTASAAPGGYEFDGWTVTGGTAASPSALTTTVNITGNAQITAKYK